MRRLAAAACLVAAAACATVPRPSPAPAAPTPTPTPTAVPPPPPPPEPTPVPTAPPPAAMPATDVDPPVIRVLLHRTTEGVDLEQPGRAYRASADGGTRWLWGPLRLRLVRRELWQVGAFSGPQTAVQAMAQLNAMLGEGADVLLETTEQGLVRVRVEWRESRPDDPAAVLAGLGFGDAFVVPGRSAVRVEAGAGHPLETEGEVVLEPAGEWPTAVGERRYRGRIRARASNGDLLVINDLNLESYLQGVLPAEMGPAQFPELEALKAQAVAARTYMVAHINDHDDEGYDLCATPACQVYKGAGVEHPLSNRAVEETAGLIGVYGGAPIDAMYTSTCGGHTEDAAHVFPDRAQPYLTGVACAWDRELTLVGQGGAEVRLDGAGFRQWVALEALELGADRGSPQDVVDRVAALCGGPRVPVAGNADAGVFARGLLAAAGLDAARTVHAGGGDPTHHLRVLADLFEVDLEAPSGPWSAGWHLQAALAALLLQGVVVVDRGEAVPHPEGVAIYPRRANRSEPLPAAVPLFERWQDGYVSASRVTVRPGTTVERLRRGDTVLATVVVRSGGDGEADRRSAWRSWTRVRTWSELASRLEVPDLEDILVTERSPSGRVVGLVAVGASGERREWSGFPVRLALGVPENLFTFHRLRRADGETVVRFLGRGWGHGVGMCQNGAYGLARSGQGFEQILATYYRGAEIVQWQP